MTATVTKSIVSLFLIIFVGVYANKKNIITPEINRSLINILLEVILPLMIIGSFMTSYDDNIAGNLRTAFYYSFVTYIVLIFISTILALPIKGDKKRVFYFANIFTNTGFIGIPILSVLYQSEGIIYGSIFNLFLNIFVWTYGVFIFRGSSRNKGLIYDTKEILKKPPILAVVFGILIMLTKIQVPEVIVSSIKSIGNMTGPLSMIVVGGIFTRSEIFKNIRDWTIYYGLLIKLIIIPAIFYGISLVIDDSSTLAKSIIIMVALPTGALTSIFAYKYNLGEEYAAAILLMTTLFSIVTLPLLVGFLLI